MYKYRMELSFISALVLIVLYGASYSKEKDRTWSSFARMMFFYIIYDLVAFLTSFNIPVVLSSILHFLDALCVVLAVYEFHLYLTYFLKDKKKENVVDYNIYLEAVGLMTILVHTVFSILNGKETVNFLYLSEILIILMNVIMILPDLSLILNKRKVLGRKNALIWGTHVLILPLSSTMDLVTGEESRFFLTTIFILMIFVTVNQETELELKSHAIEIERKEMELKEVRRSVMISQIQPHFIYNVLNIICILCRRNPKEAAIVTRTFARYLKMNVESLKKDHPVPFEEELIHAETYLSLEKVRFRDELEISYDIAVKNFCMPALSLQPMVENAVKHGLCMKEDGVGHLSIITKEDKANWYVIVSDDGVGYDTKAPVRSDGRSHIGVENTKMRVEMMCHGKLDIFSIKGSGTNVVITIPKLYDQNCLPEDRVWDKEEI